MYPGQVYMYYFTTAQGIKLLFLHYYSVPN